MDALQYFKSLADATRIRLINTLIHHELSVNEIVTLMGMGQSRISRHLKILSDATILKCRRDGIWAYYSVSDQPEPRRLIDAIQYLFAADPYLQQDLENASRLIEERNIRTRQFFNTIATNWDLLKKEILGSFDLNQAIADQIEPCATIADLGCGTGELLHYIREKAQVIIGVDSSARMLAEARKRFVYKNGAPDLRLGELEHLPLRDGEAELAVISMVLHHLSDPVLAVHETRRVLKPGGFLIIAELNKHQDETMRKSYGDQWLGFHPDEIQTFLQSAGLTLQDMRSYPIGQELAINLFKSIKPTTS